MNSQIHFKQITSAEEVESFIQAWEVAFQRQLESKVYEWVFSGFNHIYAAFDGDVLVGGYCLLSVEAFISGKRVSGGLCNNIFVNGFKYQKLGVFSQLTNFALKEFQIKGFGFVIGFPNEKAIKAHLRSGWTQEKHLPFYELKKLEGGVVYEGVSIEHSSWSEDALFKIDHIASTNDKKYTFYHSRHEAFSQWRFNQNPRSDYDLFFISDADARLGFFVTKFFSERQRVHIVDYMFISHKQLKAAVRKVHEFYGAKGLLVDCIDAWCASGDQTVFEDATFKKSEEFSYVIFKDLSDLGLSIGKNAHLVLADNDVY